MKRKKKKVESELREIEKRIEAGALSPSEVRRRTEDLLQRVSDFNQKWDRDLEFYVDAVEDWMEGIPALWTKPLPFPHPAWRPEAKKDSRKYWIKPLPSQLPASESGTEKRWRQFLAEQRKISGQEAAYLTNATRAENKILQQIVVSRAWLWVALHGEVKVGSDQFWNRVLDEVLWELPDWTVPCGDDRVPPNTKTLRNTINVKDHKRFLDKIIALKISRDG